MRDYSNSPRKLLGDEIIKKIWDGSDDVISETMMMSDIYDNVPTSVDCSVNVFSIHSYPDSKREKALKWLDGKLK